ncbi:uncharacterized protein LOC119840314 [Zerene cesonia]|uniref:uncharacterized protein LOC119840314 n=1 Tax=Zerene cesonia TaxID=33412 RepID=UPI0018E56B13|nr:uncharacterized protein LOC119840314 [Zerene cesonia]XP_038222813.1 uncharacterized protein LOC119840314 [Zerene cesonia]XP_038222814.1 uncharacterized protein LOC119840314 [Zerene cesonia]
MGKRNKNRNEVPDAEQNNEQSNSVIIPNDNEPQNSTETNKQKKKKKSNVNVQNSNNGSKKPKKIKFGDDGEVVEESHEDASVSEEVNKKDDTSLRNINENYIKDEDIDQFCDEVDEEDNKQYESWIALLEEKLGGTKTKVKNKSKTK